MVKKNTCACITLLSTCLYVCMCVCVCVSVSVSVCVCVCMHASGSPRVHAYTRTHTHTHTACKFDACIHTGLYMYAGTGMYACLSLMQREIERARARAR